MKIAVIGGIGSGKSEVLKVAREMGVECFSADEINEELLHDASYVNKLKEEFPFAVKCGTVDKSALAAEVFSNVEKRKRLNSIAHPEIMKRLMLKTEGLETFVVELPLMLESGASDYFDETVLVSSPVLIRLKHLNGRGMPTSRALKIMGVQPKERKLKKIATRIIKNDGTLEGLKTSAKAVFEQILQK
jgi:dephospho-CoA kinase